MTDTKPATLLTALQAVQHAAPVLPKDKTNPHFKSKYTGLDTIVEKIGPLLNEHGLLWTTLPGGTHDQPTLSYRLAHVDTGEVLEGTMPLLLDKPTAQGLGSALTYCRRYSLCAVLNLVADEDDDGTAASSPSGQSSRSGGTPASDAQKRRVRSDLKKLNLTKGEARAMLAQVGVPAEDPDAAIDELFKHQASDLIEALQNGPIPSEAHPSDVPADGDGFEHPPAPPLEIIA